jgi:prophage regulatory protein
MPAIHSDREPTAAPATHLSILSTRATVESLLNDLLAHLRRRGDRFLDVKQVADRTTLSRNTIWELERAGHFPHRRQVTTNKVAWLESEIEAWIASRPMATEVRHAFP